MNSLVYIMYNKRLQYKFLKKKALKDDDDPLVSEDVPSDNEWMVDEDVIGGTSTDVDMSQPSGSQQVGGKRKRNTSNFTIKFNKFYLDRMLYLIIYL